MGWVEPGCTRSQADAAARVLMKKDAAGEDERAVALALVNQWRMAHNFPLNTFQVNLRNASRSLDGAAIVAQRIKRMASIEAKLSRQPSLRLSQMQDLGGCRAVLDSIALVRELESYYLRRSRIKHELRRHDDYISDPRESGYRGVHLVYSYYSDRNAVFNDLKIEMQLRSRRQHAWATAVETVGTFVQQALKSSMGDEEWLRFFELMASEIAISERSPVVPNTPADRARLRREIKALATRLDVVGRLQGYNGALRLVEHPELRNSDYYLLELYPEEPSITVTGFQQSDLSEAAVMYADAERAAAARGGDAVLVSVGSLEVLRRAYPNYFADTAVFVNLVNAAIGE